MAIRLTRAELREAYARIRACLVEGLEDNEIADRMGIPWEEVYELKRSFYDHEAELLRARSTEHNYVRYAIEQRQCLKDLDRVIQDYQEQKNVSGYVGAVKAKSEILERTMKMGLDLGLVKRVAGGGLGAGEAIKEMSNIELRKFIVAEISEFNSLRSRFSEVDLMQMEPGPLHQSANVKKMPIKGHSRSKVLGGRRVVKEDS